MAMMIGPVTTGGKKRMTFWIPKARIRPASTKYSKPAQHTPMHAYGSACAAGIPVLAPISTTAA